MNHIRFHQWLLLLTVLAGGVPRVFGAVSTGATLELTKSLPAQPGNANLTSATGSSMGFAIGETFAGHISNGTSGTGLLSGYYGGFFGTGSTFSLSASHVGLVGAKSLMQEGLQVGVPLNAPVQLTFSDILAAFNVQSTSATGLAVQVLTTRLGQSPTPAPLAPINLSYDSASKILQVTPNSQWESNTLYDIVLSPDMLSVDGFNLDKIYHVQFLTAIDPSVENLVVHPNTVQAAAAAADGSVAAPIMNVHLPVATLPDFSVMYFNRDPINNPIRANPAVVQDANRKALAAGGPYRAPIAYEEIAAYDLQGSLIDHLSKAATISVTYNASTGTVAGAPLIRARTLSLWALDNTHHLWVKMPATQNNTTGNTLAAPVSQFSLFAVMGQPDNSAADSFVFPVPWRPHGPNAGTASGQTGTEADGIIFSNLPSECRIRIYTIAGELVRDMHHSDAAAGLIGQERWDVKTGGGASVASGVYLWRVESPTDGKNGKLMVIR